MRLAVLALLGLASAVSIKTQSRGIYDGGNNFAVQVTTDSHIRKMCEAGQVATVNYTGKLRSDNSVFDSTKGKDAFSFVLGQAEVIECWDKGFK